MRRREVVSMVCDSMVHKQRFDLRHSQAQASRAPSDPHGGQGLGTMSRGRERWVMAPLVGLMALALSIPAAGQSTPTREYIHLGGRMVAIENLASGVSVSVNCNSSVALGSGETRQCTSTVTGTTNTAVTWSVVSGGGSIGSTSGLYTAPVVAAPTTVQVKAVWAGDGVTAGTSSLTVNPVLLPATQSVGNAAQSGLTVQVTRTGAWTATSNSASMLVIQSGSSGNGPGQVVYNVTANSTSSTRTGTMTIAGVTFSVTQAAGGTATLTPTSATVGSLAGSGTVQLSVSGPWSATSGVGWATVSPTSGSGNATVTYNYGANPGSVRSGTLTIGNAQFTLNQAACSLALNPVAASVGGGASSNTVQVTSGCASWSVTSDAAWLQVGTPSGAGNGTVSYSVTANPGGSRVGHLFIGGVQFTVSQAAGATYELTPLSVTLYQGNSQQFDVYQVQGGVRTKITSSVSWLTVPPIGTVVGGLYTAPSSYTPGQQVNVYATVPGGPTVGPGVVTLQPLGLPSNASITPNSGSGANRQFNLYLYYLGTWQLSMNPYRHILFNTTSASTANSCYAMWYLMGTNGALFLGNDQGTGFVSGPSTMPLSPTTPPSNGPTNTQCSLDINASGQRYEGTNYLRLMMMVYFKPAFAGTKSIYYRSGNESTWWTMGSWTVTAQ